jgi:hypothetical protein
VIDECLLKMAVDMMYIATINIEIQCPLWEDADSLPDAQLVPPQVKPQQQSSGSSGTQPGSTVPGPSPIGAGQSPIGHPPVSLQGPLSPPPFNSTGQPSHINYQVCYILIIYYFKN